MSSFNLFMLLGLAVLVLAPLSGEAVRENWHIHVVNGLSPNRNLLVHCKSNDDDLGPHTLAPGSETSWSFRENFFLTTKFYCYLKTDRSEVASFDVFWEEKEHPWLHERCQHNNCIWTARDDGIYIRNIYRSTEELIHNWGS